MAPKADTKKGDAKAQFEDMENYSPKSVVTKLGKWPDPQLKNVDVDVRGVRVHSQVLRIRAEDSHLGKDVGEYLIRNVAAGNHQVTDAASHHVNFMIFSRPASLLSGKAVKAGSTFKEPVGKAVKTGSTFKKKAKKI